MGSDGVGRQVLERLQLCSEVGIAFYGPKGLSGEVEMRDGAIYFSEEQDRDTKIRLMSPLPSPCSSARVWPGGHSSQCSEVLEDLTGSGRACLAIHCDRDPFISAPWRQLDKELFPMVLALIQDRMGHSVPYYRDRSR